MHGPKSPMRETAHHNTHLLRMQTAALMLGCLFLLAARPAAAQTEDIDHRAVLEIGGAGERSFSDHRSNGGATIAVEATPIEGLLELESGVSVLGTSVDRRASVDFLVKKPYRISPRIEFMIGVGPEWSWPTTGAVRGSSIAAEGVLDFMFWPTSRVGWYAEPSVGGSRGANGERSVGADLGLIIGLGR